MGQNLTRSTEEAHVGTKLMEYLKSDHTQEDRQMFQWVLYYGIPFTLVATKSDKLARSKRQLAANSAAKLLGAPPAALVYSAQTGEGREALLTRIGQVLDDARMAAPEQPE